MKKILNEWRKFIKENQEDDLEVAGILLQAIETGNSKVPEMQNRLRLQKQRAIRILQAVLGDESLAGEVYETDLIYKRDFVVHFMVSTIGESGVKYFDSQKEFKERVQMALNLIKSDVFIIPTRVGMDFRHHTSPRSSDAEHSGGPGDAGLELPEAAFKEEPREILDNNIQKWINFHRALWEGEEVAVYKAGQELIPALRYFIGLYKDHLPHDEKYVDKLEELFLILSMKEPKGPTAQPEKSEYQVTKEKVEELRKAVEELSKLSRQSPTSPTHKQQISRAKTDLPTKSKEYKDLKRKMRGLRGR